MWMFEPFSFSPQASVHKCMVLSLLRLSLRLSRCDWPARAASQRKAANPSKFQSIHTAKWLRTGACTWLPAAAGDEKALHQQRQGTRTSRLGGSRVRLGLDGRRARSHGNACASPKHLTQGHKAATHQLVRASRTKARHLVLLSSPDGGTGQIPL